jgi:hypothetical protein
MPTMFPSQYGPRVSDNLSQSWQPSALSNPHVPYPASPFAQTPQRRIPPRPPSWYGNSPASTTGQLGVKAGDFGGAGPFGVKVGDFGMPGEDTQQHVTNVPVGGGMGAGAGNIGNQFQAALNNARQANEARYQDILGGYQQRYQRGLGMLAGLGQQEGRDINELYDSQGSKINQDLIGRGLGNSSVMATMAMGNNRERNADLGRLNDRVRQQAMATDAGLSGDELQFMERRNDVGPDLSMLAQLAQGMGAAGYGQGGGGGGMGGYMPPMDMSFMMPGFGGGYQSPGPSAWNQNRLANARANYAAKNAAKALGNSLPTEMEAADLPPWMVPVV